MKTNISVCNKVMKSFNFYKSSVVGRSFYRHCQRTEFSSSYKLMNRDQYIRNMYAAIRYNHGKRSLTM